MAIKDRATPLNLAAYGGPGWQPRRLSMREEAGNVWGAFGMNSEYGRLKQVVLHRPGAELSADDPNSVQMLGQIDYERAIAQHDAIADAYRSLGVTVHYAEPAGPPSPNQMYMADLLFMTPEGTILARPASEVRAGEERVAARRLAEIGIPIVRSVSGRGTFEGADGMWVTPHHVMLGRGLRTNDEGAAQIASVLSEMGVESTVIDLPVGTMHMMGVLRIIDRDLAFGWPLRLAHRGVDLLKANGYDVHYLPDIDEAIAAFGMNMVTIGPREVLMAAGNPNTQGYLESLGVTCHTVEIDELGKAAGAIGCLSGILERELF